MINEPKMQLKKLLRKQKNYGNSNLIASSLKLPMSKPIKKKISHIKNKENDLTIYLYDYFKIVTIFYIYISI